MQNLDRNQPNTSSDLQKRIYPAARPAPSYTVLPGRSWVAIPATPCKTPMPTSMLPGRYCQSVRLCPGMSEDSVGSRASKPGAMKPMTAPAVAPMIWIGTHMLGVTTDTR